MENSLSQIQSLLNEQKWTRSTMSNCTVTSFTEVSDLIPSKDDEDLSQQVLELCEDHLAQDRDSILALYISGVITLAQHDIDDVNMVKLINIFADNHKWGIVEHLATKILEFGENKFALQTLSDAYEHLNKPEERIATMERLVKIDFEAAEDCFILAKTMDQRGEKELSLEYYKKALYRFINKKDFSHIREIWSVLVEQIPQDIDFFFHMEQKIAKSISPERSAQLLQENLIYFKKSDSWDMAVRVVKIILKYIPDDQGYRNELVECYRNLYSSHENIDEYIRSTNLDQSWQNIYDAIDEFEKHIAFDKGTFVAHKSWGIGRIQEIQGDQVVIDFAKKRNHEMSLQMAVRSLEPLQKQHIWVLKSVLPPATLKEKVVADIPWTLEIIIRSFQNEASLKQIKNELVPAVLSSSEWSTWNTKAKKILVTDATFGNYPDKPDTYRVRSTPITFDEKIYNSFRGEKLFKNRVQIFRNFLEHSSPDSDYFGDMFGFFVSNLNLRNSSTEIVLGSFLLLEKVTRKFPFLRPSDLPSFHDIMEQVETDLCDSYRELNDEEFQETFLRLIKKEDEWAKYYLQLMPVAISKPMVRQLVRGGYEEQLQELFTRSMNRYKEFPDIVIWLAKHHSFKSLQKDYDIAPEKMYITLINLLAITYRSIENKRDVPLNKRRNRTLTTILFGSEKSLLHFIIDSGDENLAARICTTVFEIKDLKDEIKIEFKHRVATTYPSLQSLGEKQFSATVSDAPATPKGLMALPASLAKKKERIAQLVDVEIPKNSEEIGEARLLGDLKENAEYKAGKEKQVLLTSELAKLQDEVERVTLIDLSTVSSDTVSFGTKVVLTNNSSNKEEQFSILGPWESDPENNIISYLSPLAMNLLNHTEGETITFELNGESKSYTINAITTVA